jgi:membrane fusion protein (multidrug efflux system)
MSARIAWIGQSGLARLPRSAFLLSTVLLAACGEDQAATAPGGAPRPPAVTVAPVEARPVTEAQEFVGRIQAVDKVDLRARVTGFLDKRLFEEGQEVRQDDLLYVLEQAPYRATVDERKADLASAQAQRADTAVQLKRGEELLKNDNIPASEVDQRRAQDQMAAAQILQAQAALQAADINLGYTSIHAPIDGKIGRTSTTIGNLVGPDSGVLATIVSQDPMYVSFPVSTAVILSAQQAAGGALPDPSQFVVRLRLPDGTEYPQPGRIDFLSNQVDQGTDTLMVRAVVPNPQRLLVDGQFVTVTVEGAEPAEALVVPQAAVQIDQAGSYVLVVGEGDKVEQRRITTGADKGRDVVVAEGLKEGERIIVDGIIKARPGMVVSAEEAPAADGPAPSERERPGATEGTQPRTKDGGQAGAG